MLRDGREFDAKKIFDRLIPVDMVGTEQMIIVAVAKDVLAAGEKLTLESLRAAILPKDAARFIEIVLNQYLVQESFLERFVVRWVEKRSALECNIQLLIDFRSLSRQDKIEAAKIAAAILHGDVTLREGSEKLVNIGHRCVDQDRELFSPFGKFLEGTVYFPTGPCRRRWNPEALARKDAAWCV
jgi:hypothetical protein